MPRNRMKRKLNDPCVLRVQIETQFRNWLHRQAVTEECTVDELVQRAVAEFCERTTRKYMKKART